MRCEFGWLSHKGDSFRGQKVVYCSSCVACEIIPQDTGRLRVEIKCERRCRCSMKKNKNV